MVIFFSMMVINFILNYDYFSKNKKNKKIQVFGTWDKNRVQNHFIPLDLKHARVQCISHHGLYRANKSSDDEAE